MDLKKIIFTTSGIIFFPTIIIAMIFVYVYPDIALYLFFIGCIAFGIFGNLLLSRDKFDRGDYYFGIGLIALISICTLITISLHLTKRMVLERDDWKIFPLLWYLAIMLAHPHLKGGKSPPNP
jgi:hypothetical protein